MKKIWLYISLICFIPFVVSCQQSMQNINGVIEEHERISYPISNRKIALCQLQNSDEKFNLPFQCTLLDQVAVSDEKGYFEFIDVPKGEYIFLYDSGLADFDNAIETWAGKQIPIGDSHWLGSEFQGHPEGDVNIAPQISPVGFAMVLDCGADFTIQYLVAHMIVPDSPFIVAHDLDTCLDECELLHIVGTVVPYPKEEQNIAFPAPYLLGD